MSAPSRRARENLTGIVSVVVTGGWLAAMLTGQEWWLAAMLVGYIVVVPLVALLFGDEADREKWWDNDHSGTRDDAESDGDDEALDHLRDRYARGELTEAQFERKVERLLETETLEDAAAAVESETRERPATEREGERSEGG
ncbi:MAG: SHOCT domain-containing protein [Halolamina sp.]